MGWCLIMDKTKTIRLYNISHPEFVGPEDKKRPCYVKSGALVVRVPPRGGYVDIPLLRPGEEEKTLDGQRKIMALRTKRVHRIIKQTLDDALRPMLSLTPPSEQEQVTSVSDELQVLIEEQRRKIAELEEALAQTSKKQTTRRRTRKSDVEEEAE